jgi:K+-transporting ATPase A subunit
MSVDGWIKIALLVAVVAALTPVLGGYMARVFTAGGSSSRR